VKLAELLESYQNTGYAATRVFVLVKLWLIQYLACVALRPCFTTVVRTAIMTNQLLKILLMPLIGHALALGNMLVLDGALWVF